MRDREAVFDHVDVPLILYLFYNIPVTVYAPAAWSSKYSSLVQQLLDSIAKRHNQEKEKTPSSLHPHTRALP
jgi:hypothetical protein